MKSKKPQTSTLATYLAFLSSILRAILRQIEHLPHGPRTYLLTLFVIGFFGTVSPYNEILRRLLSV
jgi:hypothetical protein